MEACDRLKRDICSDILKCFVQVEGNEMLYRELSTLSVDNSYFMLDFQKSIGWSCEGIVEKSSSVVLQRKLDRTVEVNVESHELLSVNGEDVSGIEHKQVLSLSDEGDRWEGDVLYDEPYGWGVVYDKEGEKAYEGFRIGNVNVCYGTQYYADLQKVEYEGEWFEGKRWGRGKQYDRNGKVVFGGKWVNDEHNVMMVKGSLKGTPIYTCIEVLSTGAKCCNGYEWSILDLILFPSLRSVYIGDWSFSRVKRVRIIGLKKLEKVTIGKYCFTYNKDVSNSFQLKDCEKLKTLSIGQGCFCSFSTCEIENLKSLEVFDMEESVANSSFYCGSLTMKSE